MDSLTGAGAIAIVLVDALIQLTAITALRTTELVFSQVRRRQY